MLRGFLTSGRLESAIKCLGAWNQVESATLANNDNRYFAPTIKQILTGRSAFAGKNLDARPYGRQCETAAQVPLARCDWKNWY
jgi:hypothetical protein